MALAGESVSTQRFKGLINAMDLVGKDMADVRVAVCGCGAAGYSCAKQFLALGVRRENLIAVDVKVGARGGVCAGQLCCVFGPCWLWCL